MIDLSLVQYFLHQIHVGFFSTSLTRSLLHLTFLSNNSSVHALPMPQQMDRITAHAM